MHKEEIQGLLDRFGFRVSVNRTLGESGLTHMIHVDKMFGDLVEYTIEEATNLVRTVWLFRDGGLNVAENTTDIEIWLGE